MDVFELVAYLRLSKMEIGLNKFGIFCLSMKYKKAMGGQHSHSLDSNNYNMPKAYIIFIA